MHVRWLQASGKKHCWTAIKLRYSSLTFHSCFYSSFVLLAVRYYYVPYIHVPDLLSISLQYFNIFFPEYPHNICNSLKCVYYFQDQTDITTVRSPATAPGAESVQTMHPCEEGRHPCITEQTNKYKLIYRLTIVVIMSSLGIKAVKQTVYSSASQRGLLDLIQ